MSQVIENEEFLDDEIGQTSDEAESTEDVTSKYAMNIYEVMLLISLVCVFLATILLLFELRMFGDFPNSFPWRTSEFLVK